MIFGVAGPNGAGKGEIVDYLAARSFTTFSLSDMIREELARRGTPVIPCFWHQQLFVDCLLLQRLHRAGLHVGWLISPSADGELAARVAERWGIRVVRGSATRSGTQALRGLYRALVREQVSPVVVPDGPTGTIASD